LAGQEIPRMSNPLLNELYAECLNLGDNELRTLIDQARRLAFGAKHYGALDLNKKSLEEWLTEMYQEMLDGSNYARWALDQLKSFKRLSSYPPLIPLESETLDEVEGQDGGESDDREALADTGCGVRITSKG
jgi:hypothetical protein